jgi:hypothetical protein
MSSTDKATELEVFSNCWSLDRGEKIDGGKLLKDAHAMINNDDNMPSGISSCEAFGMSYGCLPECPTLTSGDCKTIKECPEDFLQMISNEGSQYIEDWDIDLQYPEFYKLIEGDKQ